MACSPRDWQRLVLLSEPVQDWQYLEEGNQHIVFRYLGTHDLLRCKVLIMNKDLGCAEHPATIAPRYIAQHWFGREYISSIVYPLHVTPSFVSKLVSQCQHQRPKQRRKKHALRVHDMVSIPDDNVYFTASLQPDVSSISGDNDVKQDAEHKKNVSSSSASSLAFDFKPKWMFLNDAPFIHEDNIKKRVCRFAMHQRLKYGSPSKCKQQGISKFCPLSLLSHDVHVIAANICHLMHAKQTNFKILFQNTALKSFDCIRSAHIYRVASIILRHRELLIKLSMLQRLDEFDISCYYKMWMQLKTRGKLHLIEPFMRDTKQLDVIIDDLQKIHAQNDNVTPMQMRCSCDAEKSDIQEMAHHHRCACTDETEQQYDAKMDEFVKYMSDETLLMNVTKFALSTVFKDCQIVITIDLNRANRYKITIIDLHPKPIERIETKWLHQDREIVENYINTYT